MSVQFKPLPKEIVTKELVRASKYFRFPSNTIQTGFVLDYEALDERGRKIVDNGDVLPDLIYYWTSLAINLLADDVIPASVAMIIPHKRLLLPIESSGFVSLLCSIESYGRPGTVLAMGIDGPISWEPKWPVNLAGIIYPAFDRRGAICQATPDVYEALNKFLPSR